MSPAKSRELPPAASKPPPLLSSPPPLEQVPVPEPGKYRVVLDSDAWDFGGKGRVGHDVDHFSQVGWGAGEGEKRMHEGMMCPEVAAASGEVAAAQAA